MTRPTKQTRPASLSNAAGLALVLLTAFASPPVSAQPQGAVADSDDAPGVRIDRKGFVLAFGLGAARVTTSMSEGPLSVSFAETGVSTDFKIGYAPSDQLLLYWSADGAFRSSPAILEQDGMSFSGLGGVGATYFLKPGPNSFFLSASLGRSSSGFLGSDGGTDSASGSGFAIGGGYEFSGHWLVDADIVMNSFDGDGFGASSERIVRVGLSWLHY